MNNIFEKINLFTWKNKLKTSDWIKNNKNKYSLCTTKVFKIFLKYNFSISIFKKRSKCINNVYIYWDIRTLY